MTTSLIETETSWLTLSGPPSGTDTHCLDLFTQGDGLYLRVTLFGNNPGGGQHEACLRLHREDVEHLRQALAKGLNSA